MSNIIAFVLFILSVLIILLGAHFLLYVSVVHFFTITSATVKIYLAATLLFLCFSFLISVILLRWNENVFTHCFYIASVFWIGLLIYLVMATGLIWFIFGAKKLIGHSANMRTISVLFYGLAALVSFYGIWNAFHPRLKNIEVEIEDLPPVWKNKIVVQLSDVHLGIIHGTNFLRRVVSLVNAIKPHIILITGDLFDGMAGDLTSFIEPLNNLQASKGVFFVTGNHEGYLGLKRPLSIIRDTHISVLDMEVVDVEGLQIVGISFPEFDKEDNVKKVFELEGNYNPEKPSILLYHTPTNITESNKNRGSQQFNTYWAPDIDMTFVKQKGIDLQLSGHTHQGQLFPFGYLTKLIYKGYDYGLHKDGRFNLYTTSGVGTWGPPMRIGSSSEIPVIRLK